VSFHPFCRRCRQRHPLNDCPESRLWGVLAVVIWAAAVSWMLYWAVRRFL
jgi:hypothetical protein